LLTFEAIKFGGDIKNPFNGQKCINKQGWGKATFGDSNEDLTLFIRTNVLRFCCGFARMQIDFINGMMHSGKMRAIAYRYHLPMTDAIEFGEAERLSDAQRFATAMTNGSARGC
jgi:hypothetical protein